MDSIYLVTNTWLSMHSSAFDDQVLHKDCRQPPAAAATSGQPPAAAWATAASSAHRRPPASSVQRTPINLKTTMWLYMTVLISRRLCIYSCSLRLTNTFSHFIVDSKPSPLHMTFTLVTVELKAFFSSIQLLFRLARCGATYCSCCK